MKKVIVFLMVAVLALAIVGCGKKESNAKSQDNNSNAPQTTQSEQNGQSENNDQNPQNEPADTNAVNPVELVFHPATSTATGAYATIKVSADIKFDDESAWLGLCPAGKDYVTELEADDVDVIWYNADATENETDPHVFSCDFTDVADGTYALVVATSDDENVGYIVIQLEMTKQGDTLTFNYDNAKIKERPEKK